MARKLLAQRLRDFCARREPVRCRVDGVYGHDALGVEVQALHVGGEHLFAYDEGVGTGASAGKLNISA